MVNKNTTTVGYRLSWTQANAQPKPSHWADSATNCEHGPNGNAVHYYITSDTRVIISAYQIEKLAMITRVSGVIRPGGF